MKRLVFSFVLMAAISSCGNSGNDNGGATPHDSVPGAAKDTNSTSAEPNAPTDPDAQKGLDLVARTGCFQCHKVDEQLTGPAYQAIAERYKDHPGIADTLVNKVIKGGSGNWGTIPMPPNDVSPEDAKLMVKYVLSLKK